MSFIESTQKPKLVEGKMIERINKVQKLLAEQNITFTQQLGKKLFNYIMKNIGSIIVFILLICLLYFRYNDVQKKKEELKKRVNIS